MASFQIKISGNPGNNVTNRVASIKTQANAAVQWAGLNCESLAKQRCPVDTGRLRSSIKSTKIGDSSCTCGTNVKYAKPVEFGHKTRGGNSFVAPKPYLRPAFQQASNSLLQDLKAIK